MKILPYHDSFKQKIGELIVNIQTTEFNIPITLEQQPDLTDIPTFYQTGNGNFWVATINDEVVGTISLLDIGNKIVALRKMFVHPDHRGSEKGIAAALLKQTFTWSEKRNIAQILLGTTDKFKAAHRFYEKHGFSRIDKSHIPDSFPVMEVDSIFYEMTF